ncbi:TSUP family transporter [Vallitalea okinawensis]|uniref:TSUP family transporter n=1 Tax=Vallitalea okinawensis TaxID=2078660 RepID=UPI000CFD1638|nr:TSUP family transporter [Vallitalea okinawensis]
MDISWVQLGIICLLVFFAGLVDSIAGGGGLISVPAYFFAGIPAHFALGTNKFSAAVGTFLSTLRFIKNKRYHLQAALVSIVSAFIGSALGARLVLEMDERVIQIVLVITLPVIGIYLMTKRGFGKEEKKNLPMAKVILLSILSAFLIGAYDGFYGPGTGTLLILFYTGFIGFDLTTASGNAKIVNLTSNIAALITFIIHGKVLFFIGIPAAICSMAGHWIGSGLAIKNGAKVIRPVFIAVFVGLMLKIVYDIFM